MKNHLNPFIPPQPWPAAHVDRYAAAFQGSAGQAFGLPSACIASIDSGEDPRGRILKDPEIVARGMALGAISDDTLSAELRDKIKPLSHYFREARKGAVY